MLVNSKGSRGLGGISYTHLYNRAHLPQRLAVSDSFSLNPLLIYPQAPGLGPVYGSESSRQREGTNAIASFGLVVEEKVTFANRSMQI